jgi:hypothetical protein
MIKERKFRSTGVRAGEEGNKRVKRKKNGKKMSNVANKNKDAISFGNWFSEI